ncbi:DnaJ C-terminal domain-containing protein [Granulibacter bethesdensis]|uniref:DnaJ C-terminal domain-containing protein n=1 Tax=Granulibacter bethesdensis TaxID=364410 RepID=UPI0003F1DAC7|nr:DnaJ C-terminal domain-containing protein [Granulibacter bethesdensis]AHJ66072.1 Curved DNA-binding protein [Granulibacter bethesdensis CGDNIH4]
MADPYETLGVRKDASAKDIRDAYRRLAKKYHPDVNPGDTVAETKFKDISAAHALLSDTDKRARYDRGEIDATGQERGPAYGYSHTAQGQQGNPFEGQDFADLFGDLFNGGRPRGPAKGQSTRYQMTISFLEAVNGVPKKRITMPDGKAIDLQIPPGAESGQVLRLRGQGAPGHAGGPAGDVLIALSVAPHPIYRREEQTIHLDVPITYAEAVLGAKIEVPTPRGAVTVTVPPHSDSGTKLRLRGRGVPAHGGKAAGDAIVTLRLVLGTVDPALEAFLRDHQPEKSEANPRQSLLHDVA